MDGYLIGMIVMFMNVILLTSHSFLENALTFIFTLGIQIFFFIIEWFYNRNDCSYFTCIHNDLSALLI